MIDAKDLPFHCPIKVTWIDTVTTDEWSNHEKIKHDIENGYLRKVVITLGFTLNFDEDYLYVVQSIDEEEQLNKTEYFGLVAIPKGCIKEIEILGDKNAKGI